MLIVGTGGLAKDVLQVLLWMRQGAGLALFDNYSADAPNSLYGTFPVCHDMDDVRVHWRMHDKAFVVAVGNPCVREALAASFIDAGGQLTTLVSNHALVAQLGVELGQGVCVMPHALVMVNAKIGDGTLVNKAAQVSHDARVGRYCTLSPGARLLGASTLGDLSEVGTNAVVLPGVTIGTRCKVGAGAIVTRDVPDGTTVIGNPAERMSIALQRRRRGQDVAAQR